MSGSGLVVNVERRRAGSIGMEERALSTLEKFVELCDKGGLEEEEADDVAENVLDDALDDQGAPEKAANGNNDIPKPDSHDGARLCKSSSSGNVTLLSKPKKYREAELSQNKAKLCELFIDRTLLEMKTKPDAGQNGSGEAAAGSNGSGTATKTGTKKSEEIWVKRVNDPGRRSFRITNFRGQQLPSILTEDVDEGNENAIGSYPSHYHTVTGATNTGYRAMLKPFLQARDDERGRHKSGDNVVKTKSTSLLDAFRPRSKSDASKMKKPNFMSKMGTAVHNSLMGGSSSESQNQNSSSSSSSGHRPRSGSDSLRSPVSKVMDIFRHRSHSVNASDDKRKNKHGSSNSWTPQGARRSSLHSHRPSDVSLDPAHAAILFRDSRGLPVADPFLERILNLSEEEENEILVKFFKFHKCYDLIPTSAKLVVFDTQLLVKKAFFALVYNGVRAAPLWDSTEGQFVGMLTITDFIRVLHAMYHDSAGRMSELEEHRVETWRRRFLQDKQPLIFIDPDASLYDAICSLVNNRIHRLPVIDKHTGNVLHILTHKRILKFLFLYIHEIPRPSFLNTRLREVRIGTFDNVETAREETPIIQALQKFLDRRVSALPIVDAENRLLDIYARFDVINLAAEKTYNNLDITLKQANEHRNEWFEGVHKCTLDETLFVIMEKIVKAEVHRLVVVDEGDRVVGVISLSDILQYLVMRPELKEVSVDDIKEVIRKEQEEKELAAARAAAASDPAADQFIDTEESCNIASEIEQTERENPTIIEEEDEKT